MSNVKLSILPPVKALSTGVDTQSSVTYGCVREDMAGSEWQRLIDYQLIDWGCDSGQLDDDETPSPSRDTVRRAIIVAGRLGRSNVPSPTRIVPDAHGGIVFEREAGSVFESIRVAADGGVEYCEFENCRMVQRQPLQLELSDRDA